MTKKANWIEVDSLEDINNGLLTIDDFSDDEILVLNDFANDRPRLPLAGTTRQDLSGRAATILAQSQTSEDDN